MSFFSIIIPTYNRAHMLPKTIESVINQTFSDWELIIVDDGSTDNTKVLIEEFIAKDARIKYIYQENAERSAARNNGIENAGGEYICFLDSDDWYEENHLSTLFKKITNKKNARGLFFTNYNEVVKGNKSNVAPPILESFDNTIDYLMTYAIIPARVCVHHEILNNKKFDIDITIIEDVLLWSKIALKYPLFHIKESTVNYLLHEDNSINLKSPAAIKRLEGLKKIFKRYPVIKQKLSKRKKSRLFGETYFGIAKYYIFHKKKYLAIMNIIKSWFYNPINHQNKHKAYLIYMLVFNKKIDEYSDKSSI